MSPIQQAGGLDEDEEETGLQVRMKVAGDDVHVFSGRKQNRREWQLRR